MIAANPLSADDDRDRLQRLFDTRAIRGDGCWGWSGTKNEHGYGLVAGMRAHRLSVALHIRPLGKGELVLHSCDNPECSNPAHLRVGTQSDNMRDAWERKRGKLPDSEIARMRALRRTGQGFDALAAEFGVARGYVKAIVTGAARREVPGPLAHTNTRLSDADVRAIRHDHAAGARTSDTAKKYNITAQHVCLLAKGKARPSAGGPFTSRPTGVHHSRIQHG